MTCILSGATTKAVGAELGRTLQADVLFTGDRLEAGCGIEPVMRIKRHGARAQSPAAGDGGPLPWGAAGILQGMGRHRRRSARCGEAAIEIERELAGLLGIAGSTGTGGGDGVQGAHGPGNGGAGQAGHQRQQR